MPNYDPYGGRVGGNMAPQSQNLDPNMLPPQSQPPQNQPPGGLPPDARARQMARYQARMKAFRGRGQQGQGTDAFRPPLQIGMPGGNMTPPSQIALPPPGVVAGPQLPPNAKPMNLPSNPLDQYTTNRR